MATANTQDVELRVRAVAEGVGQIRNLADEIELLAKEGADAAPEFKALADQLRLVGEQTATAIELGRIADKLDATKESITGAKIRLSELTTELTTQQTKAAEFSAAQDAVKVKLDAIGTSLRTTVAELREYKAKASDALKATQDYDDKVRALTIAIAALRTRQAEERAELQQSKDAASSVNAELAKAEAAYNAQERTLDKLGKTQSSQTAALNTARTAIVATGKEVITLANAQERLDAAYADALTKVTAITNAEREHSSIVAAVAAANEKAVAQARAAAAERIANAERVAAAERSAAAESNASLLNQSLKQQEFADKVAALNNRAVAQARAAAAAREAAARQATAAEKTSADASATALLKLAAAQESALAITKRIGAATDEAFAKTGVRSAQAIQAEINKINAGLDVLAFNTRISGTEFDRAFGAGKAKIAALRAEMDGIAPAMNNATLATNKLGGATALLRQGASQLTAAFGLFEIGRGFITANVQMETLRRTLTLTSGSVDNANKQIEFLRSTAERTGLAVRKIAQDYTLFSASATAAGVSLEQQQRLFLSVASAAGKMGLSADRVGLVLGALAQTANKGKITLEELQGQLGDSFPAALKLSADGLGVTTDELLKLIKSGVDSNAFFEAFTKGADQAFGSTDVKIQGLQATWNRFLNSLDAAAVAAGDSGGVAALTKGIQLLGVAVLSVTGGIQVLFDAVVTTFRLMKSVVTADVQGADDALNGFVARQSKNAEELRKSINDLVGQNLLSVESSANATKKIAESTTAVAAAQTATAASTVKIAEATAQIATATATATAAQTAAVGVTQALAQTQEKTTQSTEVLAASLDKSAASTSAVAAATTAQTAAIIKQGGAVAKLDALNGELLRSNDGLRLSLVNLRTNADAIGASYEQLKLRYGELADAADKNADVSKKLAEAKKIEGDASVRLASLAGNEAVEREASARAATEYAKAIGDSTTALEVEVEILRQQRASLEAAAIATGSLTNTKKEELKTLQTLIDGKQADIEKSRQSSQAAKDEAAARQVLSQSYKDNSANVEAFRSAVAATGAELARVSARYAEGKASLDQLASATRAAAGAQALLRDALADVERVAQQRIKTLNLDSSVLQAKISSERAYQQAALITAESLGRVGEVIERQITLKELDRKSTLESIKLKIEESKIELTRAEAAKQEAISLNEFQGQKRLEIEARLAAARAKVIEANEGRNLVRVIDAEIEAMKRRAVAQTVAQTAGSLSSSFEERNKRDTKTPGYDDQGFRQDSSGSRFTGAGQLKPPDNSGNWRFVNKQFGALTGDRSLDVPGFGYWESTLPFVAPKTVQQEQEEKANEPFNALGLTAPNVARKEAETAKVNLDLILADARASSAQKREAFTRFTQIALNTGDSSLSGVVAEYGRRLGVSVNQAADDVKFDTSDLTRTTVEKVDPLTQPGSSSSHTVNITINGQSSKVNTASAADAQQLAELLRQLGEAANRVGT